MLGGNSSKVVALRALWGLSLALLCGCPANQLVVHLEDAGPDAHCTDEDSDGYPGTGDCPDAGSLDCNDQDSSVHPGATELCNNLDDDCDKQLDDGLTSVAYYKDKDGDGYGSDALGTFCAPPQITGAVAKGGDCDDQRPGVHPGATEFCNTIDDDCNGQVDDNVVYQNWYPDLDSDGYGTTGTPVNACAPVAGRAPNSTDCDDGNPTINPGATEVCNGIDDNCNAQSDEGLPFPDYYLDSDGDGFGAAGTPVKSCKPITGRVTNSNDCNDAVASINPGAPEQCNGLDDNCNNTADEGNPGGGATCTTAGLGVCRPGTVRCVSATLTCVANTQASAERCDGQDNDCDGSTDEDFPLLGQSCSAGVGVCLRNGAYACKADGSGTRCGATPGSATALACDSLDNDCDGTVDEPGLGSTVQIHPLPWEDFEAVPYYYSASPGCQGGLAGTGTDAFAGGGLAVGVQAGKLDGIRYLELDANGDPIGLTLILTFSYEYSDVAIAQSRDGFILVGICKSCGTSSIHVYYRDKPGTSRAVLVGQLTPASGNTLDSLRVVRGNGSRVTILYRESGTATASAGLKLAQVEPYYSSAWGLRDARTQAANLSAVTLIGGNIQPGLGADSTQVDWGTSQTCQSAATQRTVAVAYLPTPQNLVYFTVAENGTGKSADMAVATESSRSLGEPEVAYFQSAGDQWFIAYTASSVSAGSTDLVYWMTTSPSAHSAWAQAATDNGAASISRPRASVTGSDILLTALRWVNDPSGFKRQTMGRRILFNGTKSTTAPSLELPMTSGSCPSAQADCRPGNKAGLTNWAATGKIIYSASGSTPAASFMSELSCN